MHRNNVLSLSIFLFLCLSVGEAERKTSKCGEECFKGSAGGLIASSHVRMSLGGGLHSVCVCVVSAETLLFGNP